MAANQTKVTPTAKPAHGLRERRSSPAKPDPLPAASPAQGAGVQALGNLTVQQLLRSGAIQPKLAVSQPDDPDEREADRVADRVMRMEHPGAISSSSTSIHRSCAACEAGGTTCPSCAEEERVQRKDIAAPTSPPSSPLRSEIAGLRGGGEPLSSSTRAFFEPRFGSDLSHVRVHTGREAADSARAIRAHAYTAKDDIVFGESQYAPDTTSGKKLLAHELTHVMQQPRGVISRAVARNYSTIQSDLTYGVFDWEITDTECDEVLGILTALSPTDLEDTVRRMQREALVTRLTENVSATARTANATLLGRIQEIARAEATGGSVPAGPAATQPPPESAARAPETFDPCLVDVYALTNAGLLSYYQRALAVVNQGRDAPGYFDNRNLQRRLITERDRRADLGHYWLATMPDAVPLTLYRLRNAPAGSFEALEVPGSTDAGLPEDLSSSPLGTRAQFDHFLQENSIERVSASEYMQRTAPFVTSAGIGMAGITSGFSMLPFGMGGYRNSLLGLPMGPGFAPPGTRYPVPGAVFGEGIGILDYFAQPFELGYGRTITRRLAAGGTVPIDYPITFDIDEPLPVGDPNASPGRQVGRALDPQNRQLLDSLTNRRTKGLGIDFRDIARGRNPLPEISLADDPSAIFTRRFGEVTEMRQIFNDAVAAIPDRNALTPTQLKNQINRNIRDIIQNGRSPEGIAAREALRSSGFEYVPGRGIAAVRPSMLRLAGAEGLRGAAGGGIIAVLTSGGIMLVDTAEHPEWARELAISGSLGTGSSFLAGTTESLVYRGGMRMMERSLAETGATSLTPGMLAGGGRLAGGAVGAMFVEGISMGLIEKREHFAPEIATRTVRSGLLGAGSVWAGAGAGAAVGSVVPVAGTAIGFVVGLIVGGVVYYAGDRLVPGGREDWDAYEAGCHFRPVAGSAGSREPEIHYCFTGDTPVRMADGTDRRIDRLREGDSVSSYDERDGSLRKGKVLKVVRSIAPTHLELHLAKNGITVGVTGEHPIHTDGAWLQAKELRARSIVTWLDAGAGEVSAAEIANVTTDTRPTDVYDLSVSDCHTFFAGGILAHNKNI